jgi:hypothetical protein
MSVQDTQKRSLISYQEFLHVVGPLGVTIVKMGGVERTDIVGFAVVIPGDDLQKPGSETEDFVPAVIPQEIRWEDPVLTVWNFLD